MRAPAPADGSSPVRGISTPLLRIGMIPVALGLGEGAEFRAPLGRAVIGGVITSTVLTLVVIPTFYEIMDEWREKIIEKVGLGKKRAAQSVSGGVAPLPEGAMGSVRS